MEINVGGLFDSIHIPYPQLLIFLMDFKPAEDYFRLPIKVSET